MSVKSILAESGQLLKKRSGAVLLAFWYLFITSLFEFAAIRGMGPQLPHWIKLMEARGPSALSSVPQGATLTLSLAYASMLLIIIPFSLGGVYGGIAAAVKSSDSLTSLFAFFRYGWRWFWQSLAVVVLAVISALLGMVILMGISTAFGVLAKNTTALDLPLIVLDMAITLWAVLTWGAIIVSWLGRVYYAEEPVWRSFFSSIGWVFHHYRGMMRFVGALL
ncbi:MAG: hypothetical protein OWS74_05015, partial [Firmicutes bacterium]|nr:hypothetical protein [Bacillota bacterium]